MALMAPPQLPPRVALADGDGDSVRRWRFRAWQMSLTVAIVFATAWFFTLGPIPGILAVMVAKHLLVAILVMGLGVDAPQQAEV
jgi:hypothetical protein